MSDTTVSSRVVTWLNSFDRPFDFTINMAATMTGTPVPAVRSFVHRAARNGKLLRSKNGADWVFTLEADTVLTALKFKKPAALSSPTAASLRDQMLDIASKIEAMGNVMPDLSRVSTSDMLAELARRDKANSLKEPR